MNKKYIGTLLKSIKAQKDYNFDYEIIVADANSIDETVKISKQYGCKIIKGGHLGYGRNQGAKIANGKYILFLDADIKLKPNSFNKWFNYNGSINYDVGKPYLDGIENNTFYDKIINLLFFKITYITYILSNITDAIGLIVKKICLIKYDDLMKNII